MKADKDRKTVEVVCRKLRAARIEQGLSQQKLAEMAGISRTGLRHIESLGSSPTLYSILKLTKALDLDLARLSQLGQEIDDFRHVRAPRTLVAAMVGLENRL